MEQKAQAGLEYLMTYGWALILVVAIIGILVVIVSTPSSLVFSSSDPTKILLKAGNIDSQGNVTVILQNATGGKLNVTGFTTSGDFTGSKLNGVERTEISGSAPVPVLAGGEMRFTDISYAGLGQVSAEIEIQYKNYAELSKSATIRANGTTTATATAITTCGYEISSPGKYALANNLQCSGNGIIINSGGVVLNLGNKALIGNETGNGVNVNGTNNWDNITIINSNIMKFAGGITKTNTGTVSDLTLNNNIVKNNTYGLHFYALGGGLSINNSTFCCNSEDMHCEEVEPFEGSGNKAQVVNGCTMSGSNADCTGVTC